MLAAMQAIDVICAEVMKMDVKPGCYEKNRKLPCWLEGAIIPLNRDSTVEIKQANYRHMEIYVQ